MKEPCEDCGGKYCMCDACQSMKKMIQELDNMSIEEIFSGISLGEEKKDRKVIKRTEIQRDKK